MEMIFTDDKWQEVFVSNEPNASGEFVISFNDKIDDCVDFLLTAEQVEELCHSILEHIHQYK